MTTAAACLQIFRRCWDQHTKCSRAGLGSLPDGLYLPRTKKMNGREPLCGDHAESTTKVGDNTWREVTTRQLCLVSCSDDDARYDTRESFHMALSEEQ